MKPLSVKIRNVRSYNVSKLDYGDVKLIYYYGLNGSGKTTIARALLFLIGMEPEDQDIRRGEDFLEVEGIFDVSGIVSKFIPREDRLHLYIRKERGKRAKYFIVSENGKRRVSRTKIIEYFSELNVSPSQVFVQMGSIPLPFRSAVEEHIKRRGLSEHRRRRFFSLMELMGIRNYIGVLEEKKIDYDKVMEIYKEAKLDLLEAKRNLEILQTRYERFLEYKFIKKEISKLESLKKVIAAANLLSKLRDVASKYGYLCSKLKQNQRDLNEKKELLTDINGTIGSLQKEYERITRLIEEYEKEKDSIISDIGRIDAEIKNLGHIEKPLSSKYMEFNVHQLRTEIERMDTEIKSLTRWQSKLKNRLESVKGKRKSIEDLLKEREHELSDLEKNAPEKVDNDLLKDIANKVVYTRNKINLLKEQYKKWKEKLDKTRVIVKDSKYAEIISKVLSIFLDKDIKPVSFAVSNGDEYPSLYQFIETTDERLSALMKRIFVVSNENDVDKVRARGDIAIIGDEMWDWWGKWDVADTQVDIPSLEDRGSWEDIEKLENILTELEREYNKLENMERSYNRYIDRLKFIRMDIESLKQRLRKMPNVEDLMKQLKDIDDRINSLLSSKKLAEATLYYKLLNNLIEKRDRLNRRLLKLKEDYPNSRNLEDISARLSSLLTERDFLEKDVKKLSVEIEKYKREMLSLRDTMTKLIAMLGGFSKDELAAAVNYDGEMSLASIENQLGLLRKRLSDMGNVEDVSDRYEELKKVVFGMEQRFNEINKWKESALEDLLRLKNEIINSIARFQIQLTKIFSEFLSTFGFDGKVEINIDIDAPRIDGNVVVYIKTREGVWSDYDVMRLSGGEGTLVAFSLYLAAWMIKVGEVHFLMVDEAQTNLDKVNFEKLLRLLLEKVPGQIHVFTMVEPPTIVTSRNDTVLYHVTRNIFSMYSEVVKVE